MQRGPSFAGAEESEGARPRIEEVGKILRGHHRHLPRRDGTPIPVLVFSARELPAGGPEVAGALVKSRTSNTELLAAVRALLTRG